MTIFIDLQVVQLVQRMADHLQTKKLQVVFLINNYHEVSDIAVRTGLLRCHAMPSFATNSPQRELRCTLFHQADILLPSHFAPATIRALINMHLKPRIHLIIECVHLVWPLFKVVGTLACSPCVWG